VGLFTALALPYLLLFLTAALSAFTPFVGVPVGLTGFFGLLLWAWERHSHRSTLAAATRAGWDALQAAEETTDPRWQVADALLEHLERIGTAPAASIASARNALKRELAALDQLTQLNSMEAQLGGEPRLQATIARRQNRIDQVVEGIRAMVARAEADDMDQAPSTDVLSDARAALSARREVERTVRPPQPARQVEGARARC